MKCAPACLFALATVACSGGPRHDEPRNARRAERPMCPLPSDVMPAKWWLANAPCPAGAKLHMGEMTICCDRGGERLGPCLNLLPDGRPSWFRIHAENGVEGWTVEFLDHGFTIVKRPFGASHDHAVQCVRDDHDHLLGQYHLDRADRVSSAEMYDCQHVPWAEIDRGAAELQSHCRPGTILEQDVLVHTSCPSSPNEWCRITDANGVRLATPIRPLGGPLRGVDSRVGEYRAGPFTIAYDKGLYSGDGCPQPGDLEWSEETGARFRTRLYKHDDAIVMSRTWPGLVVSVTVADPAQVTMANKILDTVAFDAPGRPFDLTCP